MAKFKELWLQKKEAESDGQGGMTYEWKDQKCFFGQVNAISGSQRVEYQKADTEVTHEIISANYFEVEEKNTRIVSKKDGEVGNIYEIEWVDNPSMRNRRLIIEVKQVKE